MKSIYYTASIVLVVSLLSCSGGSGSTSSAEGLYKEVMAIHDEVMPRMDDIYRIQTRLKKELEDAENLPEEKRKELEEKILRLEEASRSMMVWMREFNPAIDSLDEDGIRAYYKQQKDKIEQVKEDMLSAIQAAE